MKQIIALILVIGLSPFSMAEDQKEDKTIILVGSNVLAERESLINGMQALMVKLEQLSATCAALKDASNYKDNSPECIDFRQRALNEDASNLTLTPIPESEVLAMEQQGLPDMYSIHSRKPLNFDFSSLEKLEGSLPPPNSDSKVIPLEQRLFRGQSVSF